ncbi:MAG: hypothetical protein ACOX6S_15030 [Clostridia bacterium]|jgi:Rod binding domain-containing protein
MKIIGRDELSSLYSSHRPARSSAGESEFLDRLRQVQGNSLGEEEKLEEVSRMLESFFLQKLFQSSRIFQLNFEEEEEPDPFMETGIQKLADEIARQGLTGLSESLKRELSQSREG